MKYRTYNTPTFNAFLSLNILFCWSKENITLIQCSLLLKLISDYSLDDNEKDDNVVMLTKSATTLDVMFTIREYLTFHPDISEDLFHNLRHIENNIVSTWQMRWDNNVIKRALQWCSVILFSCKLMLCFILIIKTMCMLQFWKQLFKKSNFPLITCFCLVLWSVLHRGFTVLFSRQAVHNVRQEYHKLILWIMI